MRLTNSSSYSGMHANFEIILLRGCPGSIPTTIISFGPYRRVAVFHSTYICEKQVSRKGAGSLAEGTRSSTVAFTQSLNLFRAHLLDEATIILYL